MGLKLEEHAGLAAPAAPAASSWRRTTTTIVDGAGDSAAIKGRINQIKTEIENTDSDLRSREAAGAPGEAAGGVAV